MRLSEFAQDVLLSAIYRLKDIELSELTTAEKSILDIAIKFDRTQVNEHHPDGDGGDCFVALVDGQCPTCGYQLGEYD